MNKSNWTFAVAFGTVGIGLIIGALAFLETPRASAEPGQPLSSALEWMPESAGLVGHIDVESVVASPLSGIWSREAKSQEGLGAADEIREATGVDLWTDVSSLTFSVALPSASRPSDEAGRRQPWGMVVTGTFDPEQLIQKAKAREGATTNEESYRNKTIYHLAGDGEKNDRGDDDVAFAMASDSLLLLGSPDYLREMIDSGTGSRPNAATLVESWGYGDFAGEAFWIAGKPNGAVDSVLGRAGDGPALRSFALSGRLSTDLSVTARGKAADSGAAQKLADVVRGLVALGRLQQGGNPQIARIADAVSIEIAGDEVHLGLAVPYETVRSLFDGERKSAIER
jgi:hypothetical protein